MTREPQRAPPRYAQGDLTSLAPHERLPEILVVPRISRFAFILLGSKITTDGDCSHEIKRLLLLGRKVKEGRRGSEEAVPGPSVFPSGSIFLPGESHGQRSLAGYSPWDRKELDTTEVT